MNQEQWLWYSTAVLWVLVPIIAWLDLQVFLDPVVRPLIASPMNTVFDFYVGYLTRCYMEIGMFTLGLLSAKFVYKKKKVIGVPPDTKT